MDTFKAFRIDNRDGIHSAGITDLRLNQLTEGDVVIEAHYSGVNYKDALAGTGRGKILRHFPLNGGIDVSGRVVESNYAGMKIGADVLVTGSGLGERYDGGFAEYVRIDHRYVIPLPENLSLFEAMIMGTPALTAALALHRMEQNGQSPTKGPILITGAGGAVGNIAIDIFSRRGYEVVALTSRAQHRERLKHLGATEVLLPNDITMGKRPLETAQWGGAVDTIGGETLAWLTRTVHEWGNIACIGLAADSSLNTTVMPFILRGVSLLGISSTNCDNGLRRRLWGRLGKGLKPNHLDKIINQVVTMEQLPCVFDAVLDKKSHGRTVVEIKS